jgi:geranylgeranyl diphosphate synthase type II
VTSEVVDAQAVLARFAPQVAAALERILPEASGPSKRLFEAMRYSVLGAGKRVRPALCLASCEAVGGDVERATPAAAAIELVHTYSLIHDDLPCMDDDDLRRGRPTNHKVYGEAFAVLAGDGLLTLAFEGLADAEGIPPAARLEMIHVLAGAAGCRGMVGGQAVDLDSEGPADVDLPTIQFIHTRKTGALFGGACRIGALAGGGGARETALLGRFGEKLGLAFQIADDLLDETGKSEKMGKASGKDRARGKATYPRILGIDESRRRVEELGRIAGDVAAEFGGRGRALAALARFVVERSA